MVRITLRGGKSMSTSFKDYYNNVRYTVSVNLFFPFHVYVKNNTTNDDKIKELKKENHDQQEIKKKDKEIAHLHGTVDNLKGIVFFS